jgi:acetolactate synthase I/II/III large subunit
MSAETLTVGEALIRLLEQADIETVFGIPGVHTIELYRGLAASKIRHITPRHEQSAAFMADGYARVSGKPGVCLLITGPGLTNALTAMAQARADSIPMLVISGVNARETLGKGLGHLHELPDQSAMVKTVALWSHTLMNPDDLGDVLAEAFTQMTNGRPSPVHIEIPTDVMKMRIALPEFVLPVRVPLAPDTIQLAKVAALLNNAKSPVILCGGGSVHAGALVRSLAEKLDAPVVSTVNARGIIGKHELSVPASPSLNAVRDLLTSADLVLALGTEFGPTDYDMYDTGVFPVFTNLIRVDSDAAQLARKPETTLAIEADAGAFLENLLPHISASKADGVARAEATKAAALSGIQRSSFTRATCISKHLDRPHGLMRPPVLAHWAMARPLQLALLWLRQTGPLCASSVMAAFNFHWLKLAPQKTKTPMSYSLCGTTKAISKLKTRWLPPVSSRLASNQARLIL